MECGYPAGKYQRSFFDTSSIEAVPSGLSTVTCALPSIMLDGNAHVTVLSPDGTASIDDVSKNDLWYFPAGYPHSIQGLGPDGCEFLLVFDEGMFSEENTFLISEWVAHTPPSVL